MSTTSSATEASNQADQPLPLDGVSAPRARRKQAKHRVRSRHERAGRRAGVPVKSISLSVPASVATAWRAHSQAKRHSLVDVMLDAISAHRDGLADLVRTYQAATRQAGLPVSDGLFLRTPAALDDAPEPFVTVPLRLLSTNVDTLDALSYETAAESRSQFVVAVLSAYLSPADATASSSDGD